MQQIWFQSHPAGVPAPFRHDRRKADAGKILRCELRTARH